MQQRLQTTAKLAATGISPTANCLICDTEPETHAHLFFKCAFSTQRLHCIKAWLGIHATTDDMHQLSAWV